MHNLKQVTMSLFHNHLPELLERREIFIQVQNWDIVQTQKSVAIYQFYKAHAFKFAYVFVLGAVGLFGYKQEQVTSSQRGLFLKLVFQE